MNPEEGELRPQLLDRFGLVVEVAGPRDPVVRTEIVRRRLAFETDPETFATHWAAEQAVLSESVIAARKRLPQVILREDLLTLISQLCCDFEVDGLRADLALHRTARARAAFQGRPEVNLEDVRAAAELVLPHRRKRRPFEQPQQTRERLDEKLDALVRQHSPDRIGPIDTKESEGKKDEEIEPSDQLFETSTPQSVRRVEVALENAARIWNGYRNPTPVGERGHFVRAIPDAKATNLALGATIHAAARRGDWSEGQLQVIPADLHRKERSGRTGTLLLFVVDASGSMAARRRMEFVKGAVLSLLKSAYEQRDEVAVIAFRGPQAEVLLRPTQSVDLAEQALRTLPTGGRTPLAHALDLASEVVGLSRRAHPELPILLVLLSDGRANVPLPTTKEDPWQQALQAAAELARVKVPALVLDTDASFVRLGRVQELAQAMAAECLPLEDLSAETLVLKVRQC
jgi:magnesium chelatase subunit D